jgi:bifunctional ADP-heptose synthase (sugar kinase/adenylyltransferase)
LRNAPVTAVVISDYCKGAITPEVVELLADASIARVLIDTKRDPAFFGALEGAFFFPNHQEYEQFKASYDRLGRVIVTKGPQGADYLERGRVICSAPAVCAAPLSTVGAGDTVVAGYCKALLENGPQATQENLTFAMLQTAKALASSPMTCVIPKEQEIDYEAKTLRD